MPAGRQGLVGRGWRYRAAGPTMAAGPLVKFFLTVCIVTHMNFVLFPVILYLNQQCLFFLIKLPVACILDQLSFAMLLLHHGAKTRFD